MGNLQSALLIFGILGGFSVFFIGVGIYSLRDFHRREKEQTSLTTTGVVVDERKRQKRARNTRPITYWHPVIHYTVEGREYESEYPVGQRLETRLEVGSSVDVFYDPSDPEKYHIAGDMADYRAGKHCIVGGLLGLVGAAAFAFYAYFS